MEIYPRNGALPWTYIVQTKTVKFNFNLFQDQEKKKEKNTQYLRVSRWCHPKIKRNSIYIRRIENNHIVKHFSSNRLTAHYTRVVSTYQVSCVIRGSEFNSISRIESHEHYLLFSFVRVRVSTATANVRPLKLSRFVRFRFRYIFHRNSTKANLWKWQEINFISNLREARENINYVKVSRSHFCIHFLLAQWTA